MSMVCFRTGGMFVMLGNEKERQIKVRSLVIVQVYSS